jgi:type IV pilus assembly protein PilA
MKLNSKGVTLIELLIVIVVIGIISAFAVPAVGNFLDSAKKQAVYQDAVAVRNAAAWYCSQPDNTCAVNDTLEYSDISTYLEGFDATKYETGTGVTIATLTATNTWQVSLDAAGANSGDYEWASTVDPLNGSSADVTVDNND